MTTEYSDERIRINRILASHYRSGTVFGLILGFFLGTFIGSKNPEMYDWKVEKEPVAQAEPARITEPIRSYFERIQPENMKTGSWGETIVRTDFDKDGVFDMDEVYVQQSPMAPIEVNIKEGYENFLERRVSNMLKVRELKSRQAFNIRDASYFGNPY